ncbi:glutaconate CoA-transferase subunit A [Syntrophus gentianae]|uniref:Glutaconate CoA-transferase subunit A n=1 Tax=Syntrophus gentianae TaxID=43775 RepID=A0A1H7UVQ7_9BACT|nr:CoA-transferase [Syntrophus gentianae]SEM00728.1 glutaconate CoA-transferase subunit A [Syntrophus gentianae]
MEDRRNKVMDLDEAIRTFVRDGSHMSIGGFSISRNPMAAVYTIIRQGIKNLHFYVHSNGTGIDELIGGGCISRLEIAYGGNGKAATTCIRFRKAVQEGTLQVEDYSNYQMTLRFAAGAMGVPFLPTRSSLGTDIINRWGFSEETRNKDPKIADKKLVVLDNPFGSWADAPKVVLVPAIHPDVTIIHVQRADYQGTCRILGLTYADIEQAKASRHVIVTCEELVEPGQMRENPGLNQIPFIHVSAVCHVPYGAYPTAVYRYYDYDPQYLIAYARAARDEQLFRKYQDEFIYGVNNHGEFLDRIGRKRLEQIQADPRTGYAVNLQWYDRGEMT